jgi:ATP-dependent helicase HrpA
VANTTRLDHPAGGVAPDRRRIEEVRQLESRYDRLLATTDPARAVRPELVELTWALEEFRVSVFAQPLGALGQVSGKRLRRELARLELA